jgi:alkanesulfonate monooxygenase SsuD/methylene tetrahydromethanopterin reductase-like flavin-dependent oxidoreductase (luciferase family)
VRFGVVMPNFGDFADPSTILQIAHDAEAAGWEGFFVWDHINPFRESPVPLADPWTLLSAVAAMTERILIGPMVTPVPRRRPWVLARQTATLDALSRGRLVLGVGSGVPADTEFEAFGEEGDLRIRAQKLDEGLAVLAGLWTGEPFEFEGRHYRVDRTRFLPSATQKPRIPIWVGGTWPNEGPIRRAAHWDGYFPVKVGADGDAVPIEPGDVEAMRSRLAAHGNASAEIVVSDEVTSETPLETNRLHALEEAGATWYLDGLGTRHVSMEQLLGRIRQGPPRL